MNEAVTDIVPQIDEYALPGHETPLNPMGGSPPDQIASFGESTPMKRAG
jgi:hypothetical protein